jgi:hypothetical protein
LSDIDKTQEDRLKIIKEFADKILDKYRKRIKSIVLFGDPEEISALMQLYTA